MAILHGTGWLICTEKESPDDYAKHYHRRSIIEGVFSAMKRRMQSSVRSRIIRWWRHYAGQQFGMQYPWHTIWYE